MSFFSSFASSVAPSAGHTFADVVDELHELRAANKELTTEKELLQAQVALLSQQRVGDAEAPRLHAVHNNGTALQDAQRDGTGASAMPHAHEGDSLFSLRSELAANLGVDQQQVDTSQLRALGDQLAAARSQADALCAERDATMSTLLVEVKSLEVDGEAARIDSALGVEGLRAHCAELQLGLDEQRLQMRHAQQTALTIARKQSAARITDLEEQLAAAQDAAAQRELLFDELGADSLVEEERRQRAVWMAKCQVREQELRTARDDLGTVGERHAAEMASAKETRNLLESSLGESRQRVADVEEALQRQLSQTERLTQSFDRQVEETAGLRAQLARLQAANAGMVEKREARAWVVNFIENADRRPELLQLMASWWDFGEADRLRTGMLEEPPPGRTCNTASLSDAFASFLHHESELSPLPTAVGEWSPSRTAK